jgi:hypothetical protein
MKVFIDEDGIKHLQGSGMITHETLCGACDTFTTYIIQDGITDCKGCIKALDLYQRLATRKEIKNLMKLYKMTSESIVGDTNE